VAIVGAYILAGELSKSPADVPKALLAYQSAVRPYVDEVQNFPAKAPQFANPQTATGITILRAAGRIASTPLLRRLTVKLSGLIPSKKFMPPEYPALQRDDSTRGSAESLPS
jgi:hypothetical protein